MDKIISMAHWNFMKNAWKSIQITLMDLMEKVQIIKYISKYSLYSKLVWRKHLAQLADPKIELLRHWSTQ